MEIEVVTNVPEYPLGFEDDDDVDDYVDLPTRASSNIIDLVYTLKQKPQRRVSRLTEIEVVAIISVLEDVYYQLSIVGCPGLKHLTNFSEPLYRTIEERVNSFRVNVGADCGPIQGEIEDTVAVLKHQTRTNSIYLIQIVDDTMHDLVHSGTYEHLQDYVIVPYFTTLEECELVEVMNDKLREIEKHKKNLELFHEINSTRLTRETSRVQQTKGYFARIREFIKKETDYVNKWETCRRNQHSRKVKASEEAKKNGLLKFKMECDSENYAHIVIMDYLNSVIKGIKLKLKEFEYRRTDDMDHLDEKLEIIQFRARQLRREVEDSSRRHRHLTSKLTKIHRIMIEEKAVKIIQTWWRTMRDDEKKKAKGKKKEKGKKGKGKKGKGKGKGKETDEEEEKQGMQEKEEKKESVDKKKSRLLDPFAEKEEKKERTFQRKKTKLSSFADSPVLSYENIMRAGKLSFAKPASPIKDVEENPSIMERNSLASETSILKKSIARNNTGKNKQSVADILGGIFAEGDKNANKNITVNMASLAKEVKSIKKGETVKTNIKPKQTRKVQEAKAVPKQIDQRTTKKAPLK